MLLDENRLLTSSEADSHPNAIPHSVKNCVFLEDGKRNF